MVKWLLLYNALYAMTLAVIVFEPLLSLHYSSYVVYYFAVILDGHQPLEPSEQSCRAHCLQLHCRDAFSRSRTFNDCGKK